MKKIVLLISLLASLSYSQDLVITNEYKVGDTTYTRSGALQSLTDYVVTDLGFSFETNNVLKAGTNNWEFPESGRLINSNDLANAVLNADSNIVKYIDNHKWDYYTEVTNKPAVVTYTNDTINLGPNSYDLDNLVLYEGDNIIKFGWSPIISKSWDLSKFPTFENPYLYLGDPHFSTNVYNLSFLTNTVTYYPVKDYPYFGIKSDKDSFDLSTVVYYHYPYGNTAYIRVKDKDYNLDLFPTYSGSQIQLGYDSYELDNLVHYAEESLPSPVIDIMGNRYNLNDYVQVVGGSPSSIKLGPNGNTYDFSNYVWYSMDTIYLGNYSSYNMKQFPTYDIMGNLYFGNHKTYNLDQGLLWGRTGGGSNTFDITNTINSITLHSSTEGNYYYNTYYYDAIMRYYKNGNTTSYNYLFYPKTTRSLYFALTPNTDGSIDTSNLITGYYDGNDFFTTNSTIGVERPYYEYYDGDQWYWGDGEAISITPTRLRYRYLNPYWHPTNTYSAKYINANLYYPKRSGTLVVTKNESGRLSYSELVDSPGYDSIVSSNNSNRVRIYNDGKARIETCRDLPILHIDAGTILTNSYPSGHPIVYNSAIDIDYNTVNKFGEHPSEYNIRVDNIEYRLISNEDDGNFNYFEIINRNPDQYDVYYFSISNYNSSTPEIYLDGGGDYRSIQSGNISMTRDFTTITKVIATEGDYTNLVAGVGITITNEVISVLESYVNNLIDARLRKAIDEGIELDGTNYVLVIETRSPAIDFPIYIKLMDNNIDNTFYRITGLNTNPSFISGTNAYWGRLYISPKAELYCHYGETNQLAIGHFNEGVSFTVNPGVPSSMIAISATAPTIHESYSTEFPLSYFLDHHNPVYIWVQRDAWDIPSQSLSYPSIDTKVSWSTYAIVSDYESEVTFSFNHYMDPDTPSGYNFYEDSGEIGPFSPPVTLCHGYDNDSPPVQLNIGTISLGIDTVKIHGNYVTPYPAQGGIQYNLQFIYKYLDFD